MLEFCTLSLLRTLLPACWQVELCLGWRRPVSFSSLCGGAACGCRYRSSLQLRACWQVEVCRRIMEAYVRERYPPTRDPLITHTLMRICRLMHDSINALSCDDEVRSIGSLICAGLIRSVEFGSDLERQLAWLVECRAAFCNIDPVLKQLVHSGLSSSITSRVDTSVCATLSVCLSVCLPPCLPVSVFLVLYILSMPAVN